MSDVPARSEDSGFHHGQPHSVGPAPVVVTEGLTYRDLQRTVFLAFGLVLIYQVATPLTTLLLLFLLVFILSAVMNPLVTRLERRGVPRIVSALGMAVAVLALLGIIGWLAVPPLATEVGEFVRRMPEKQARLTEQYNRLAQQFPQLQGHLPKPEELFPHLTSNIGRLLGTVGRYTVGLVAGVVSLLVILVLVIYTVAHPTPLITGLLGATPARYRDRMVTALRRIMQQLTNWAGGTLILGLIIGLVCGLGLRLIGVPYALLFGVLAGIGEMIPNIGPILSAVPPVLVALADDPKKALMVIALFIIVQQLENNLVVPMVMGQSLNIHPVSLTFTVLVMGALFGVLGAVLAVPVCAIVKVCWQEFYLAPQGTDTKALEETANLIVRGDSPEPKDKAPVERALERAAGDEDSPESDGSDGPEDAPRPARGTAAE